MYRYRAVMKKGDEKIYVVAGSISFLKRLIADKEKIGFKQIGEIERV